MCLQAFIATAMSFNQRIENPIIRKVDLIVPLFQAAPFMDTGRFPVVCPIGCKPNTITPIIAAVILVVPAAALSGITVLGYLSCLAFVPNSRVGISNGLSPLDCTCCRA